LHIFYTVVYTVPKVRILFGALAAAFALALADRHAEQQPAEVQKYF
jgi:hypothetical protein